MLHQFSYCCNSCIFRWYHGRLDRIGAEERLRSFRGPDGTNLGSYLVRESDRKPGSYVLSYLGKTGINHFRVTAVCGDFYIGGRQFDSLQDLIGKPFSYEFHISMFITKFLIFNFK